MPAIPEQVTTIEELLALPDDRMRHELLDGEHVVTPAPSVPHQRVLRELMFELDRDLSDRDDVELFSSPADIVLTPRTLVQPDLFVVVKPARGATEWTDVGCPLVAIEILSPTTASRDRNTKRRLYLANGVEEYWIVDIDARVVERWRAGDKRPEIVDGMLRRSLKGGASGEIDLPALVDQIAR